MQQFPCPPPCPPAEQPRYYTLDNIEFLQSRVASPAPYPHYVIPGSHAYDPFYAQQIPPFPFPRAPLAYESETRAVGTGLLPMPSVPPPPPPPCPPPPCPPPQWVFFPWQSWRPWFWSGCQCGGCGCGCGCC